MQRLLDRDLLSGLVLLLVGAIALSESGSDIRNWIFPRLATYVILAIGAMLLLRVIIGAVRGHLPDSIDWAAEDRVVLVDLLVCGLILLAYLLVMHGLGFWLSTFLMLSLTSIYLTGNKTPRNIGLAIVVPLAACILAYVIFLHVFYVPLPTASWWSGFV